MHITLFGGSFDPPHLGHLAVAEGALRSGRCDEVLWVPAFAPPHKLNNRRESFPHRLNMLRLMTALHPGHRVSDIELRRQKTPSYTFELLEYLNSSGTDRYSLLIGADSLLELHTWYKCQELAERFELLVYPRADSTVSAETLRSHWDSGYAEKLAGSMLPGKNFEISSTILRFSMEKHTNWSNIISMTDPAVAEYCRRHGLYNNARSKI